MSRTVLVLTATGTTGSQTVAALARRGAQVRAATRDPAKGSFPAGVTPVAWSFDDRTTWEPALTGVDALYLATAPFRGDEVAEGEAIIAAAKRAGVKRIVKLSAAGVENNPAATLRRVELAVEASGLEWIHVRPSFFFENFIEFYGGGIKADGAIYLPAGKGKTGFVAAEDIGEVAATALLSETTGEAWVVTGGESLDHDEVAERFTEALGRPVRFVDISPQQFADTLRAYGSDEVAVASMSGLYDMVRAGWTGGLSGDVERVLGRRPIALVDWVRAHAAAWAS
jgi:uncharacterized protein YbjT (DUF2867 family)